MKKILAMLTAALLLMPMAASAEGEETAGAEAETEATETEIEEIQYQYGLDAEGHAELYDFLLSDTYEGALTIPSEIEGHPVDYVGNACFMNAKGITEVTIPACITDMGDSVFLGCTALECFIVEEGNPYFSVTDDGVLLADKGGFLISYPAARAGESYTIPKGVDEIGPGAFGFAQNLKEIIIPDGVVYIDTWAFSYACMEKVTIAGSVVQIDDYAFAYCESLKEVDLGHGIEIIYNAAFYHDGALEQITLPDSLTMIGQYAFCGTGLTCITIPNSLADISYCAFGYADEKNTVPGFIIYGEPYTAAQTYATDYDLENDYQNNFEFIAVADASIPYELGGGKLYDEADEQEVMTETDENGDIIILETDENGNPVDPTEEIGAGLKDNVRLQMMLGIGGGIAVVLAIILGVSFAKKPKQKASSEAGTEPSGTEDEET